MEEVEMEERGERGWEKRRRMGTPTPRGAYHRMCLKVYGNDNSSPEDNPTYRQSSCLEYYKKALSFYVLPAVRKKEVRQLEKKSLADHAFEDEEFMQ
eukprot:808838-Ditylum_brightwellii.AAC.2